MKRRTRIAIAALVAAGALAAPFVLGRTRSYYTDLGALREDGTSARGSIRSVLWERAAPLPPGVNTGEADEYEARVSPDGRLLVFTRGRPGEGADLWIAERAGNSLPGDGLVPGAAGWTEPRPLSEIDTSADETGGAFAMMRGARAALFFASDRPGGHGRSDIWVSLEGEDGAWGAPVNLGPDVNSALDETTPSLSSDGSRLFFASNRRTGKIAELPRWTGTLREAYGAADQDIYVAERKEAAAEGIPAFGAARPVPGLDTDQNEGSPCLDSRVGLLYFASDRPGGRGGLDLWRARIDGGDPISFENLGPSVNGPGHELDPAISPGGFELHFARRDPGSPTEEIFHSVSREVFLDREAGEPYWSISALFSLLRRIPPAVLAALLSILLLLVFGRILRWRMTSLALITRCFLLAILIHCLIAVWMNTKRVQRVLLAILPADEKTVELMLEGGGEEGIGLSIRGEVTGSGEGDALPPLRVEGSMAPAGSAPIALAAETPALRLEPAAAVPATSLADTAPPAPPALARDATIAAGPLDPAPVPDGIPGPVEPVFAPADRSAGGPAPGSDAPLVLGARRAGPGEGRAPLPEGTGLGAVEAPRLSAGSPAGPGPAPAGRVPAVPPRDLRRQRGSAAGAGRRRRLPALVPGLAG